MGSLHDAVQRGDERRLSQLLEDGQPRDAQDDEGRTPLHVAAERAELSCLALLLARDARTDLRDAAGHTPLERAVQVRNLAAAELLLAARAECDRRFILHLATRFASPPDPHALVRLLLAYGAAVHEPDEAGRAPLHHAVIGRYERSAELLLAAGANPRAQDGQGWSPLHLAAFGNAVALAQLLLRQGANPDLRDTQGRTALDCALEHDHRAVAALLGRRWAVSAAGDSPRGSDARPALKKTTNDGSGSICCGRVIAVGIRVTNPALAIKSPQLVV